MATYTLAGNPAIVTAGNTSENVAVFDQEIARYLPSIDGSGQVTATVEIVSGTFNFNSQGQPAANGASYTTAGTKVLITFSLKTGLSFKGASAADQFKISV